jgi:Xaa-Pro aminopeptidase
MSTDTTTDACDLGPGAAPYPRFSEGEMQRRADALAEAMEARDVDHVILYGANRSGSAIPWLTGWPVTREAVVVFTPGERNMLLVSFYNHVPNAERIAADADVRWTGESTIETVLAELAHRGASGRRIGVVGPMPYGPHARLADFADEIVAMDNDYVGLRLVKSAEELDWVRVGAALTDRGLLALRDGLRPGLDEHQLSDLVERAYVPHGGRTHIHYLGVTSMASPRVCVPAQWPANNAVSRGDAVTCELSASFWDYTGQVLRTFAVGEEPTPQYRELHDVADTAFDAIIARLRPGATASDLLEASRVIEEAGYTTRDDLVHGFVGGYLPPVLRSASRQLNKAPEFTFAAGMTLVVQPNVITRDEAAGVQTGELVAVGAGGAKRLHRVERGLIRIGPSSA